MVLSPHDIMGTHVVQVAVPVIASSAATNYVAVVAMPFDCTVQAIRYTSTDAVTGANTNTVHLNADNDAGTEIANIDLISGVDVTAGAALALTLTATVADLDIDSGDTVRLEAEEVGTGLGAAIAEGVLIIEIKAR